MCSGSPEVKSSKHLFLDLPKVTVTYIYTCHNHYNNYFIFSSNIQLQPRVTEWFEKSSGEGNTILEKKNLNFHCA